MFHRGDKVGPYTLIRTLGRGGYGEVWLAERASSLITTQVALKLPHDTAADLEAIRQEAQVWLKASGHPNVVPVLDAEVYDGQVAIAGEYIAGGSLHDWMRAHGGKAESVEEALAFTSGILAGLDYLHRAGITHRDLKPENVLLQHGVPRLTDFGLARVLNAVAQSKNISGTPRYMAPETFSGSYSTASDLWAVGVLLQELLTGSHPFPADGMMALIIAIQGHKPAPIPETIPERLRTVVARMLAKSPSDRFASASAVREALQNSARPVSAFPVAPTVAGKLPPGNLPLQPTSFIGRQKELTDLKGFLTQTRLLTLTGAGGSGKTRLSLQAAKEVLDRFPDGAWLVELAPLANPALLAQAVAEVLGIGEAPGEPIQKTILRNLKDKKLLLVMDNCEHVLESAATLVELVLRSCADVRILVSSREALGIAGETTYQVLPLAVPDPREPRTPEIVSGCDSVRLFVERAMDVKPDFAVSSQNAACVAAICRCLDGIPLALELAAARVRSLPIEQINARLNNRFHLLTGGSRTALPRQQTLRALVDWSYELLSAKEKAMLLRLSVFAGGWTLEAAEAVVSSVHGSDPESSGPAGGQSDSSVGLHVIDDFDVLDLLTALADKSLVLYQEGGTGARYRMLETIRHYAQEKLLAVPDAGLLRTRHRDFYLSLAENAALRGPESDHGSSFAILQAELDNLRAALLWSLDSAEKEHGLRLAIAMYEFWARHSIYTEPVDWFDRLLAAPRDFKSNSVEVKALCAAGTCFWRVGRYAESRQVLEQAVPLARSLGADAELRRAVNSLANTLYYQGEFSAARPLYEEALRLARSSGSERDLGKALNNLGLVESDAGNVEAAKPLFEEGLALRRKQGDQLGVANLLNALGTLALSANELGKAETLLTESYEIYKASPDRLALSYTLHSLARLRMRQGAWDEARRLVQRCLHIKVETGEKWGVGIAVQAMAEWHHEMGQDSQACTLLGASDSLLASIGTRLPPAQREEYEKMLANVCQSLSQPEVERLWAAGGSMTLEQVLTFVGENTGSCAEPA